MRRYGTTLTHFSLDERAGVLEEEEEEECGLALGDADDDDGVSSEEAAAVAGGVGMGFVMGTSPAAKGAVRN